MAACWCLPEPHQSGRCLTGEPGDCPSLSCWCKWWAEHQAPVGSAHTFHHQRSSCWPAAPAAELQPLSERDLSAVGKDTLLSRVKLCQRVVGPCEVPLLCGEMSGTLMLALTQPCRGKPSPGSSTPSTPGRKHIFHKLSPRDAFGQVCLVTSQLL